MASDPLKFGVLLWPQYTDWPALMRAGARAEQLGYDSLASVSTVFTRRWR